MYQKYFKWPLKDVIRFKTCHSNYKSFTSMSDSWHVRSSQCKKWETSFFMSSIDNLKRQQMTLWYIFERTSNSYTIQNNWNVLFNKLFFISCLSMQFLSSFTHSYVAYCSISHKIAPIHVLIRSLLCFVTFFFKFISNLPFYYYLPFLSTSTSPCAREAIIWFFFMF